MLPNKKNILTIICLIIYFSFLGCFEKRAETDFKNTSSINTTDTPHLSLVKTDSISNKDTISNLKKALIKRKKQSPYIYTDTIDFLTLQQTYPDFTSGRTNCPEPCKPMYQNCGFYNFIDDNSKLKLPIVAIAVVSFSDMPWKSSSKNQELLRLVVKDSVFLIKFLPFDIGDNIDKIKGFKSRKKLSDDVFFYIYENYMVAVKIEKEVISQYAYWTCSQEDFEPDIKILNSWFKVW